MKRNDRSFTKKRISWSILVIISALVAYVVGNQKGLNAGYNEGFEYGIHCQAEEAMQLESLEYKPYGKGESK